MKKILFAIFAAAAMSAACTQFEEDTVPSYDSAAKPEVSATVVSDTEITVTVTAGAGTNFWGYAVMTGAPGATADKLVADGYAKSTAVVVQGEDKTPQAAQLAYSEETKTVTLELKGLTPYTDYTVYAAAVSKMGVVSEVAEMTVKTTDGTEPVVNAEGADYEVADGIMTFAIPFSDPVSLTGEGTAKAYFYGENLYDEDDYLVVYKEVDIPADYMATSGKYLILAVPAEEYIPGAYVSVTYSADIVVNGAGSKNVAFEKNLMAYIDGELLWNGIVGQYDYENWDFSLVDPATLPDEPEDEEIEGEEDEEEEEEKVPVYFQDWTKLMMLNYTTSEYPLAVKTVDAEVNVTTVDFKGRAVSYESKNWDIATKNIAVVMLDEAPEYGSYVSYTIAEGSVADIFGNVNNEFAAEDEYYFSYGYTMDDIIGTYSYTGVNASTGKDVAGKMTIEASDDEEEGNFMITSFAGLECQVPIYGDFNPDSGSIDIYGDQPFYEFTDDNDTPDDTSDDVDGLYSFYTYSYYWLNMSMTESGYISNPNDIFGLYVQYSDGLKGWALPIYNFSAQKVEEEETPAPTPSPAKVQRRNFVELPSVEKK